MFGKKKVKVKIWNIWEYNGWGRRINWLDFSARTIEGHLPCGLLGFQMIKEGDEVRAKMKSGKIARFKVKKVKRMSDPQDQFFADLEDVEYLNG